MATINIITVANDRINGDDDDDADKKYVIDAVEDGDDDPSLTVRENDGRMGK